MVGSCVLTPNSAHIYLPPGACNTPPVAPKALMQTTTTTKLMATEAKCILFYVELNSLFNRLAVCAIPLMARGRSTGTGPSALRRQLPACPSPLPIYPPPASLACHSTAGPCACHQPTISWPEVTWIPSQSNGGCRIVPKFVGDRPAPDGATSRKLWRSEFAAFPLLPAALS